jgi:hypothetical protein
MQKEDSAIFIDYLLRLDYTLDPNVFNFILNLILELKDFSTGIALFEMIIDDKFKKINLSSVDVSKQHLKHLLKIQTLKLKEGEDFLINDLQKSLIVSGEETPKKNKLQQIQE